MNDFNETNMLLTWLAWMVGVFVVLYVIFYIGALIKQFLRSMWAANHIRPLKLAMYPLRSNKGKSIEQYYEVLCKIKPCKVTLGNRYNSFKVMSGNIAYPPEIDPAVIGSKVFDRFIKNVLSSGRSDLFITNIWNQPGGFCFVKETTYGIVTTNRQSGKRSTGHENHPMLNFYYFDFERHGSGVTWSLWLIQYRYDYFYQTAEEYLNSEGRNDAVMMALTEMLVRSFREEIEARTYRQTVVEGAQEAGDQWEVIGFDEDDRATSRNGSNASLQVIGFDEDEREAYNSIPSHSVSPQPVPRQRSVATSSSQYLRYVAKILPISFLFPQDWEVIEKKDGRAAKIVIQQKGQDAVGIALQSSLGTQEDVIALYHKQEQAIKRTSPSHYKRLWPREDTVFCFLKEAIPSFGDVNIVWWEYTEANIHFAKRVFEYNGYIWEFASYAPLDLFDSCSDGAFDDILKSLLLITRSS